MNDYATDIDALGVREPHLARALADFHSLEKVLEWMKALGMPLNAVDVITQDEYSHDFLLPLLQDGKYLVFGMT